MNIDQRIEKARQIGVTKYGSQWVNMGGAHYHIESVPTGSLMFDYMSGIGGAPYGHAIECFGANKLGKSSAFGYPILANVQKQGKIPLLIAVEPRLVTPEDKAWALSLGLDPDMMVILYPDNAEEAFDMLREYVFSNLVDYIMIDSIGGMGTEAGAKEDGKKQAYGNSSTITSGLNDVMPKIYKNRIGLLLINQQRQVGSFKGNLIYDSGGGEALKHHMRMRIHLKPGKAKYTADVEGEKVLVGQELLALFVKNNMAARQGTKATFDFFHIATDEHGFGIDQTQDIINVGKMTGVIHDSGNWFSHEALPKKMQKKALGEYLAEEPEVVKRIRDDVMTAMLKAEQDAARRKKTATKKATVIKEAA